MECAKEITCRATIDKNMERMGRLLGLETNVQMVSAPSHCAAGFALNCCQQRHSCTHYSSCMEDVRHRCIKYSDRALILQIALLDSHFESSELIPTLSNSSFYETQVPGQWTSAILSFLKKNFQSFQLWFLIPIYILSPSVFLIIFTFFLSNSNLSVAG